MMILIEQKKADHFSLFLQLWLKLYAHLFCQQCKVVHDFGDALVSCSRVSLGGVFDEMAQSGKSPKMIIEEKGLVQVTDVVAINAVVDDVLARSTKEVQAYQNGKTKLIGYFVGQVMQETKGKANPKIVNDLLHEKLKR